LQLALADQRRRIRLVAVLQKLSGNLRSRARRQRAQLGQRLLRAELGSALSFGARRDTMSGIPCCLSSCCQTSPALGSRLFSTPVIQSNQERALPLRRADVALVAQAAQTSALPGRSGI